MSDPYPQTAERDALLRAMGAFVGREQNPDWRRHVRQLRRLSNAWLRTLGGTDFRK